MRHKDFIRTLAAERYLLGDMNDAEMQEYESHYFDCDSCARELGLALAFVRHAKAIFQLEDAMPNHEDIRP